MRIDGRVRQRTDPACVPAVLQKENSIRKYYIGYSGYASHVFFIYK